MSNDENINSGTETARDPGADIKSAALAEMAKSESIESYAAERADQDAEAAGKQPTTPPEERVNRYQAALEQARQETDQARRENGLDGEPNGFDAQVDQAIQAQVQEQELEAEFARREKQGADVALYTHKSGTRSAPRLLGSSQSNFHRHSANNGNRRTNPLVRARPRNCLAHVPTPRGDRAAERTASERGGADDCQTRRRHHG
jgi:hypothetical protein